MIPVYQATGQGETAYKFSKVHFISQNTTYT